MDVALVGAPLVSDLEKLFSPPGGFHHRAGFLQAVGHLLFAIDVQSPVEAGIGVLGVNPIRGGHDDGVQVLLAVQHLPVIFIDIGGLAVFSNVTRGIGPAVFPDVADGRYLNAGNPQAAIEKDSALLTGPDERYAQFIRRHHRSPLALIAQEERGAEEFACSHGQPGSRGGGLQKIPAGKASRRQFRSGTFFCGLFFLSSLGAISSSCFFIFLIFYLSFYLT